MSKADQAVENELRKQVAELKEVLETLVGLYVANRETNSEFISCVTPPSASEMTKTQRRNSKYWRAWDNARELLGEELLWFKR